MYPFHKVENIYELLRKYRIGDLHPNDIMDEKNMPDFSEIQHQDIDRSEDLCVLSKFPFCAQTCAKHRCDHFFTPNNLMFERNHNLVPMAEAEECEVEVKGLGGSELKTLSFDDIKNWPE